MKPYRYEILDGLRGVAALMVVVFHMSEAFSYDPVFKHLNHGYLCVDFFYVLSGFVIGFAYEGRMKSGLMSRWDFLKARFIRLQPMVLFGILLGAGLFFFQECNYYAGIGNASVWYVIQNMVMSFFMIPVTPEFNVRANTEMFVLNIPQWSMVFEYIANILFCLFVFKLGKKGLMVLVGLFALMIVDSALTLNLFGMLQPHDYPCSLNAGWSLTAEQFYIGVARVGFSFFTGLLLFRLIYKEGAALKKTRTPIFAICSFIIIAIVCVDQIGGYEHPLYDGIFNLICVFILCPFTVWFGSQRIELSQRTKNVCDFLGRLSYPLYLAHYPLVYLFFTWMDTHHDASFSILAFTSTATFLLCVALGYAALKLWDEPIRKWLAKK
ncbi:MAG: acyltransferase [Bacteroidaceae bacterium]|nr:acyltransferase [Bacteroidaceae bacterium]